MVTAERRVTIQDGIARVEDISVVAVGTMSSVLPVLATRIHTLLPVLPEGTSAFRYDPDTKRGAILVSRKPQTVELAITDSSEDYDLAYEDSSWNVKNAEGYLSFRVAMPWLHWMWDFTSSNADPSAPGTTFTFNITYLYMSAAKITDADTRLTPMRLPNVGEDGDVCWGDVTSDGGSFASRIDSRVNAYFNTAFNGDLDFRMPTDYSSFAQWHNATRDDEYCWMAWDFYGYQSVRSIMGIPSTAETATAREGWAPPPERFTVAGARDWARTAPGDARRRLLAGIAAAIQEIDETPPAPAEPEIPDLPAGEETPRIPLNSNGVPCRCINRPSYHDLAYESYDSDFFTVLGHRHVSTSGES